MISTKDFRRGLRINIDGAPFSIVEFAHIKVGRGGATVKAKLKNLKTGAIADRSFPSGETFVIPDFQDRKMQYLYKTNDEFAFMDNESFEQYTLTSGTIGPSRFFLKENEEYHVLLFEGNPISVDMPSSVVLRVTECEPAVKGDSVTNITKQATLETGAIIKAPLFIKEGDLVKVDVESGQYLERANN